MGTSFQWPTHFCMLPQNCHEKFCAMSSSVSPQSRRISDAPISPETTEKTAATRSSCAEAHSTVLPSRDLPVIAICLELTAFSRSKKSIDRLMPQAHALIVPHSSGAGFVCPSLSVKPMTPLVH